MTPQEWDGLAWWEQQMYLEGYEDEGLVEQRAGSEDSSLVDEQVHQSGGTTITERKHEAKFSLVPGEMAAFGIPERTLTR